MFKESKFIFKDHLAFDSDDLGYTFIDGDDLRARATGTENNLSETLRDLSPEELKDYQYLINELEKDRDLLSEVGNPLLLMRYSLTHIVLILSPNKPLGGFNDFPKFQRKINEDERFRKQFDQAYKDNRLTSIRGYCYLPEIDLGTRSVRFCVDNLFRGRKK